jgi:hypothetical protein
MQKDSPRKVEGEGPPTMMASAEVTNHLRSGRSYSGEETLDLGGEVLGLPRQFRGRGQNLARRCPGLLGGPSHTGDVASHLAGAHGSLAHISHDLLRRCTLLLHSGRDRSGNVANLPDPSGDTRNRRDRLAGRGLDLGNLAGDLARRLGSLLRQRFHFRGHHRKALARCLSWR